MRSAQTQNHSLDSVLQGDGRIHRINCQPYGSTEGPANDGRGNIYFIDYTRNWIVRYDVAADTCETWARETQGSNGAVFLRSGRLVSCRGRAADVVVWKEDGTVDEVLASEFEGKRFNAPNDLVASKTGWIYFTDPDFGGVNRMPEAVYALSPDGKLTCIDWVITRPNGIILTPDERVLLINGTTQREIIAYDVAANGTTTNRRLFTSICDPDREAYPGYPEKWFGCDGMAIDRQGRLYVTCGAGVEVFDAEGHSLGAIRIPQKPTNACFGGPDNRTLFVTAQTSVYCVECQVPGIVFQQG